MKPVSSTVSHTEWRFEMWQSAEEANIFLKEYINRTGYPVVVPPSIFDRAVKLGVNPELMKRNSPIPVGDEYIQKLLRNAVMFYNQLNPEAKKVMDKQQAISFVWGNIALTNENVTREMVEKAWEKLQ